MKINPCSQYKEQIQLYCRGDLTAEQSKLLVEHLGKCPNCSDYYQLILAGDKLLSDWADSLEPWIQSGQDKLLQRLHREDVRQQSTKTWFNRQLIGSVVAAGILLAAGFFAGRLSRPAADTQELFEKWSKTIQPRMQQELTDSVVRHLQPQLVSFQKELAEQCSVKIDNSTLKTFRMVELADSQLLNDLTRVLETVYIQDRQTIASALYQIERNRIEDRKKLENNIMTILTELEYPRFHQPLRGITVPATTEITPTHQMQ